MTGRQEVRRLEQRLDATFGRLNGTGADPEVISDFSRYLCILVSGYLEKALYELVVDHARRVGAPSLVRFIDQRTRKFTNAKSAKIFELVGDFDPDWRRSLEEILSDDLKDAVDSVVSLRNKIAHGESVGVTYVQIQDYYTRVQKVVGLVADVCGAP
jgi:hypothetical protein